MIVAVISRHLHTPIDMVEEWEVNKLLLYQEQLNAIIEAENRAGEPTRR